MVAKRMGKEVRPAQSSKIGAVKYEDCGKWIPEPCQLRGENLLFGREIVGMTAHDCDLSTWQAEARGLF